jgi:hypothetical protein
MQRNVIRLKNLLREAEEQLAARGEPRERSDELLAPARRLLDDAAYWQQAGEGLAIFLSPGLTRVQRVGPRLPERAVVGERFHVAPLLPLLSGDGGFHILALSQNSVRLFEATRDGAEQLRLPDVPRSQQEALQIDEVKSPLQFHTTGGTQSAAMRGGRRAAMFHGHGVAEDDERPLPLVLAGVEYELAMFREVSRHPQIVPGGIEGNPELLSADELHRRAWPLVEPALQSDLQRAVAAFDELGGSDRVSCDLEDVLRAAVDGRVDTLFADVSRQRWGRFDAGSRNVEVHEDRQPADEDLIDRAAAEALERGGSVFGLTDGTVPGGGPVAALFRY